MFIKLSENIQKTQPLKRVYKGTVVDNYGNPLANRNINVSPDHSYGEVVPSYSRTRIMIFALSRSQEQILALSSG